jgi:hypothetical protein
LTAPAGHGTLAGARPAAAARPGLAVAGQVGIVVPGHEDQRDVEPVHQVAEVLERQVAAGQDEVCAAQPAQIGVQPLVHPSETASTQTI